MALWTKHLSCASLLFVAEIKHWPKAACLETEENVYLVYRTKPITQGSQGRSLEARTETEYLGGMCTALLLLACSATSLYNLDQSPRGSPTYSGLGHSISTLIMKMPYRHAPDQSNKSTFSVEVPLTKWLQFVLLTKVNQHTVPVWRLGIWYSELMSGKM
jgi:hypothetical protein